MLLAVLQRDLKAGLCYGASFADSSCFSGSLIGRDAGFMTVVLKPQLAAWV